MKRTIPWCMMLILSVPSLSFAANNAASAPTSSNKLAPVQSLSGIYYGMRHGESVPSKEKRVCSQMASGVDPANGLTDKGKEEVAASATAWTKANHKVIANYLKKDKLVIVSSPFSRAQETAQILASVIQKNFKKDLPRKYQGPDGIQKLVRVQDALRERDFGKFEGQGNSGEIYDKVWALDRKDPTISKWDVESAADVQERDSKFILALEEESKHAGGKLYILASHGDTLKIMQTAFQKMSASEHANKDKVAPFKTAEVREFTLPNAMPQTSQRDN